MSTNPPVSPSEHGEGSFEWLAHDSDPVADMHREGPHAPERVPLAHTHARLDPLTVQGVVNRVLVAVFCLIAIGAAYETVGALSSSRVPRSTSVLPTLISSTTVAHPKTVATGGHRQTVTTARAPTTTAPPVTVPLATVAATTPRVTTPRVTIPRPTTPPATFPRPVVPQTSPATTPQTIQVPSTTPTTSPTGPSDTVVVPFR